MKCPKCGRQMEIKKEDISYNPGVEPKKEYTRKQFWCKDDDIWIRLEIPKN